MSDPIDALDPTLKRIHKSQLPTVEKVWPGGEVYHASDSIHASVCPAGNDIRQFYLEVVREGDLTTVPAPVISASRFVPQIMIEHLMRNKADSALGVKFKPGEEITCMEGAMHTFVTPIVPRCEMEGDYRFEGGHRVPPFGNTTVGAGENKTTNVRKTRPVVMSATIHLDFEFAGREQVMRDLCTLRDEEIVGKDLNSGPAFQILTRASKQDQASRDAYDNELRAHMVYHLLTHRRLPALSEAKKPMSKDYATTWLESLIVADLSLPEQFLGKFLTISRTQVLSIEMLFTAMFQIVRNEFSALEALCTQGYVYTYDPTSIFAGAIGAVILNRLFIAALKYLSDHSQLAHMRVLGFNDYGDRAAVGLLKTALVRQESVEVVSKAAVFGGDGGTYDVGEWEAAKGAMLVIHNNSDGFGQNIETEGMSSLDGAIGGRSSAAASLERSRPDLLDYIF